VVELTEAGSRRVPRDWEMAGMRCWSKVQRFSHEILSSGDLTYNTVNNTVMHT
jgi:hypothetical protein